MPEKEVYTQTVEVPSGGAESGAPHPVGLVEVSVPMLVLTWVTFLVLTVVLYKIAWKPILRALDLRENTIRKALEGAEKARAETAAMEARQKTMLQEAAVKAEQVLAEARVAAEQSTRTIEAQARNDATALIEDARLQISGATEKAREELRKETVNLAVQLASQCVQRNMNSAMNKELVREWVKELQL